MQRRRGNEPPAGRELDLLNESLYLLIITVSVYARARDTETKMYAFVFIIVDPVCVNRSTYYIYNSYVAERARSGSFVISTLVSCQM